MNDDRERREDDNRGSNEDDTRKTPEDEGSGLDTECPKEGDLDEVLDDTFPASDPLPPPTRPGKNCP